MHGPKPEDPCNKFHDLANQLQNNPVKAAASEVMKSGGSQDDLNNISGMTPEMRKMLADMYQAAADCFGGKKNDFNRERAKFMRGERPNGPGTPKNPIP
jgi:hypothetical protein